MRKKRVITSDGVVEVLSAGGQIQYRPVRRIKRWEWALWARYPGEDFSHVISSKTGEPRFYKSSNALFSFHLRMFPESEVVVIPATVNTTHEWSEERRAAESGLDREDFEDTDE